MNPLFFLLNYIACSDGNVRLTNSSGPSTSIGVGVVEVCSGDSYWSICGNDWDDVDAGVICRQLGYPFSSKALHLQ